MNATPMRFAEKLHRRMLQRGMNQQKLARSSRVSDSEVSRILGGKAQPGLVNAFRLARAVESSLDYLADDAQEDDPTRPPATLAPAERDLLEVARELGFPRALRLLEIARILGHDAALRRLIGAEVLDRPRVTNGDGVPSTPHAPTNGLHHPG